MAWVRSVVAALCLSSAIGLVQQEEPLAPVCYDIKCADIDCQSPFELRRAPGQCCPTCFASDEDVALDRHTAMKGPSPYAVDPHPAAPSSCGGVKCFRPVCYSGTRPGHVQGRCCESCVPGR